MNCRICGIELTDENWYLSKQKTNEAICKACATQKSKGYYNKNKETRGGYFIKYAKEHADTLREYRKQYYDRKIERRIHNFFKYLWGDFCANCSVELNETNWGRTRKKYNNHICKNCDNKRNKEHRLTNPSLVDYPKKYYQKNKEKIKESQRKYREGGLSRQNNHNQQPHIKEKLKRKYKKDFADNREKYLEIWAKRKGRGYIPLNEYFDGADGHHIDNEQVIFMPMFIHRKIPHRHDDPETMQVINLWALFWLVYGKVDDTPQMKLPKWVFENQVEHKQLTLF